jgi:3-deoxy-manno-octulosonate cytidylyltransferase (CMP-KDO synthetase)
MSAAQPPDHLAIIPARWSSTRFPGKPLADLGGHPLFWHVHQRCLQAKLIVGAVVATDDPRIAKACETYDVPCVLTGPCATGTDRVAQAAQQLAADGYINVQGDEPFIDPGAIDAISYALANDPMGADAVNACTPIDHPDDIDDPNIVKAVGDSENNALMFSRLPIPFARGQHPGYLRQLGLYAMTGSALLTFAELPQGPLERAESVEMLRLIEHGHRVRLLRTRDGGPAVDTPADLEHARQHLQQFAEYHA